MIKKAHKKALKEMVNYTCQSCKCMEDKVGKLEFHRIKRGNSGGEYVPNNILVLCKKCHKRYHQNEFK